MYSSSNFLVRTFSFNIARRRICQTTVLCHSNRNLEPVPKTGSGDGGEVTVSNAKRSGSVSPGGISLVDGNLYKSRSHLIKWITNNVIHEDENILALTKPSGTPVFGGGEGEPEDTSSDIDRPVTLQNILPDLRNVFSCPELDIALGNPRYHSGVVLLSKSANIRKLIEKRVTTAQSQKLTHLKYVAVTYGIPLHLTDGPEDMCFARKKFGEQRVMTVRVERGSGAARQSGEQILSVFISQPLVVNGWLDTALVQVQVNKAKWDCIETYMTEKLCSVLGDHLYSGRVNKVLGVPVHVEPSLVQSGTQNLSNHFLKRLKVHESDLPCLPLHLHRHQVELPNFPSKSSGSLVVTAPLPDYFQATLNKLQINPHPSWGIS